MRQVGLQKQKVFFLKANSLVELSSAESNGI